MNLIVAVDNKWGIGHKDQLLFRISEDMKRFRALTTGKVVILGRKTLQTFPGGQPLPNRTNIVMTRNKNYAAGSALICHSWQELCHIIRNWPDESIYVIGGTSIFEMLLPYCQFAFVTKIEREAQADCYFPNLDRTPGWQLIQSEPIQNTLGINLATGENVALDFSFHQYRQDHPRKMWLEQDVEENGTDASDL